MAGGTGVPPDVLSLLADSSPASVLGRMRAPTLLTQGEQDSLFPLSEADANARAISAAGAPVTVRWRSGGHDATGSGRRCGRLAKAILRRPAAEPGCRAESVS